MSGQSFLQRQRTALAALAALVRDRAASEESIAASRMERADKTQQTFVRAKRELEQRYEKDSSAAERDLKESRSLLEYQHKTDHQQELARYGARREAILKKAQHNEQLGQKKLDEAIWLAETLFEAGEKKPQEVYETAQKQLAMQFKRAADVGDEALNHLRRCRMPVPQPIRPQEQPSSDPQIQFEPALRLAEQRLQDLLKLRSPRMCQSIVPIVPLLALALLGAAAGLALNRGAFAPSVLWWGVGGLVAGAMLMLAVYFSARKQTARIGGELLGAVAAAEAARDQRLAQAAEVQRLQMFALVAQRDRDIQAAREKYAPIPEHMRQRRDQKLVELDQVHQQKLAEIEQRLHDGLAEAQRLHDQRQAEVQARRAAESAAAAAQHEQQTAADAAWYETSWSALETRWKQELNDIHATLGAVARTSERHFLPWDDRVWNGWSPPASFSPIIRFGSLAMDTAGLPGGLTKDARLATPHPDRFDLPALLEFPQHCSLLIESSDGGRDQAAAVLQTVMFRLLTTLPPGKVRFTIIDPVALGRNFAGFMHLADYEPLVVGEKIWTETRHIEQRLTDITEHMENVIQKYLRNEFSTIADYNEQAGEIAEPFRFVVVANFPANFSEAAARRLMSIAESGPRCGVYTLVTADTRQPLPQGVELADLRRHSAVIAIDKEGRPHWEDESFKPLPLSLDTPPQDEFLTRILREVGQGSRDSTRVQVPFEVIAPPADRLWTADCSSELRVPLGRAGATKLQYLSLGQGTAHHALIAGKTGSGKSTLLHVLITNLSLWYSPEQVEFYLVDFKKGVEFKTYAVHKLPHARAVAIESDREFGLSVLQRLDAELKHRGNLYRDLGVQDIASFRRASGKPLPRTLLIVDEFQEFFIEDDKIAQEAALLLDRLVRQGRAFGIHVLLGSQTLGGAYSLARSTIGQMAVRIALQCSESDSYLILNEDNSAARLLSRPGEAIYNDASGIVEGNSPFQIVWLPDEVREQQLSRAEQAAIDRAYVPPQPSIVFEGSVPAEVQNNHRLSQLLAASQWPESGGGIRAYLGEPIEIKEPTAAVFRRQSGHNLLLVGQREESARALLASALISIAAQLPPSAVKFMLMDGTPPESRGEGHLSGVAPALPHEAAIIDWREIGPALAELSRLVDERHQSTGHDGAEVFLFIDSLQRFRPLRQEDEFSFSTPSPDDAPTPAACFMNVLREGPVVGVHTIAWCDTAGNVNRMLGRQGLREFETRVLFQMGANDSSILIDSPLAGNLGLKRALLVSEEHGILEKFRPYALPEQAWLNFVRGQLANR